MTLRPFTIATLIAAAIIAAAVPASAQKSPPRQPRPDWGIFASGMSNTEQRLVLTVNFGGGWEDDLSKAPAPPVDPELPTTPAYTGLFGSAGASLAYTVEKKTVQGGLQFGAYGRNYGEQQTEPFVGTYSASGNLNVSVGARGSLTTTYYVGQYLQNLAPMGEFGTLPGVPPVPTSPGAFGTGDTYRGFGASANYGHSLTEKLTLTGAYSFYANDSWSSEGSEGTKNPYGTQYASAGLRYSLGKGLGLRAGYGTTIGGFGSDGNATDYLSRNIDAGVDYGKSLSLTRRSTLSFNTGLSGVGNKLNNTHFYFVGGAQFSYEIGRTWTASISVSRNTNFYQTLGQPTVNNSLTGSIGGLIGRRVSVQGGISAYGGAAIGTSGNVYQSASATASTSVALNRFLAVSGSYFYYRYIFSDSVAEPPPGFLRQTDRQGVQVSLNVWAPLVTKARRANASR